MSLRRAAIIGFLGMMSVVSCLMSEARCPCGQAYDKDPFSSDASFQIGSDHAESVHCFCRCGDGQRERLDPSATCESYEGPCERGGVIARYVCE
jgi:hypothetical protein